MRERGHEVMVATAEEFRRPVESARLPLVPAGLSEPAMVREARHRFPEATLAQRGIWMFACVAAPAMLPELLGHIELYAPDVIVHEEGEWAGPVAARIAGIPSVAHGWGSPLWSADELQRIDHAVRPLWESNGVQPGSPAGLFDHLYLDPCPPPLQAAHASNIEKRRRIRFEAFDGGGQLPSWFGQLGHRPAIYVTLGTVPIYNRAPELISTIIAALRDQDVDVIVTVGANNDPTEFAPAANTRVERYLPQGRILSACSIAVTHGGAGSTLAALSYGLPILLLPRGAASQLRLANTCVDAGVGRSLAPGEISVQRVLADVRELLDRPSYSRNAARLREGLHEIPSPADTVSVIEDLVYGDA